MTGRDDEVARDPFLEEYPYLLVVWDYDAAPDAGCYYVYSRTRYKTLKRAIDKGRYYIEWQFMVGAAVFNAEKKLVWGDGLTLDYPEPAE